MTHRLIYGVDVREGLRQLADESVHCVATSPPYWGLRDYGVPPQAWPEVRYAPMHGVQAVVVPAAEVCLGMEGDPLSFVGHLVEVFREVRRVLRKDGVCWVNLGDTYVSANGHLGYIEDGGGKDYDRIRTTRPRGYAGNRVRQKSGLQPKNLALVPHRVLLALQADGWVVRNDVVWVKPSPMAETVSDRFPRGHENIFLLTRSWKGYFFDAEAASRDGRTSTAWIVRVGGQKNGHNATYPLALADRMVRTGSPARCCPTCGAGWRGRQPRCRCNGNDGSGRATVLDPFSGSGTTGEAAARLGMDYVGIDLQADFLPVAETRIGITPRAQNTEGSALDLFGEGTDT